jgi:Uma2 family endonuclease
MIQGKLDTYLEKGTPEVWILYQTRKLYQYRGETVRIYRGDDTIDTSLLFPDLTLTMQQIFHVPSWMPPETS